VLIQFKEELTVMAAPRTIAESVEFGHSREMDRLRQLLGQWLSSVGESPPALEARIRRDIGKASRELKRLKKWKAFNESPLVFGMKFLAGQVPVISNVVTAMDAGSWAYERWVVRRNCWVAIK
jgi:hypothetical protein